MYCENCGTQLGDDDIFCPNCGEKAEYTEDTEHAPFRDTAFTPVASQPAVAPFDPAPMTTQTPPADTSSTATAVALHPLRNRTTLMGIGGGVVALIVIIVICVLALSPRAVAIDEENFPDEAIRNAVTIQLDVNGDGALSADEADAVSGIYIAPNEVYFVADDKTPDAEATRKEFSSKSNAPSVAGSTEVPESTGTTHQNPTQDTTAVNSAISKFPNVKYLDVVNKNMTGLDLSDNPQLVTVDCRNNNFAELDVSKNKNLESLLCDADVKIMGLDEAGLYERDLITKVEVPDLSYWNLITFDYDSLGRVISRNRGSETKTFTYDDKGRLVRAQNGTSEDSWFEEYEYGTNGLLVKARVYQPFSAGIAPYEYWYGYDNKGRLTSCAYSTGASADIMASSFAYEGDTLSTIKTNNEIIQLTMNDKHQLSTATSIATAASGVSADYTYTYLDDGLLAKLDVQSAGTKETTGIPSYATTFTTEDFPQMTQVTDVSHNQNVTYETNADGYITKMTMPKSVYNDILSGHTVDVSYIKFIGKQSDLPARRYVPVYQIDNRTGILRYPLEWSGNQNPFSSTAENPAITVVENGPMRVAFQTMGIVPNVASNPTEQKIAAYMAEHWSEGLDIKDEQPIANDELQEKVTSIAAMEPPATKADLEADPVYGQTVKMYEEVMSSMNSGMDMQSLESKYPDVPANFWNAYGDGLAYSDTRNFIFSAAYIDINRDGTNELLIGNTSGFGPASFSVLYGNDGGQAKMLCANDYRSTCYVDEKGEICHLWYSGINGGREVLKLEGTKLVCQYFFECIQDTKSGTATAKIQESASSTVTTKTMPLADAERLLNQFDSAHPKATVMWTAL